MPQTLKLYETVDALAVVRAWMDEHDDEIRANEGALPDELAALFEQAEGDFKTKIERVALFIREQEHYGKMAKAEKDRFAARQSSFESRVKRLKEFYLKAQLERVQMERVDCELLTVRLQKNSKPSVIHTRTPKELWDAGMPCATKTEVTTCRFGETPAVTIEYGVDNELILANYKAGIYTQEILDAIGVTIVTGKHVRIA